MRAIDFLLSGQLQRLRGCEIYAEESVVWFSLGASSVTSRPCTI